MRSYAAWCAKDLTAERENVEEVLDSVDTELWFRDIPLTKNSLSVCIICLKQFVRIFFSYSYLETSLLKHYIWVCSVCWIRENFEFGLSSPRNRHLKKVDQCRAGHTKPIGWGAISAFSYKHSTRPNRMMQFNFLHLFNKHTYLTAKDLF